MPHRSQPVDLVSSIRDGIARQLKHGHPGIDSVAVRNGINVRTVQRRLAAVGLTYSRIVDQVRLEAALSLLEDRGLTLAEVALALGYSDPAHFTRAFVRWTGKTPRAYRRLGELARPAEAISGGGACDLQRDRDGRSGHHRQSSPDGKYAEVACALLDDDLRFE